MPSSSAQGFNKSSSTQENPFNIRKHGKDFGKKWEKLHERHEVKQSGNERPKKIFGNAFPGSSQVGNEEE